MIRHYAKYLYPGVLFPEESVKEVTTDDPMVVAKKAPKGCYAVECYDVEEHRSQHGHGLLKSAPFNKRIVYFGTWHTLKELDPNSILYSNVKCNSKDGRVVKCRTGNWQIPNKHDIVLDI